MFAFDHARDFDAVLAATEPFALVRFGDGEAALLTGRAHKAANEEWAASAGPHWLAEPLWASLTRDAPGYCVGLPPGCCLGPHVKLHHEARAPLPQRTFATLFLHGNLHRTGELLRRFEPVFVGRLGSIAVPDRGVQAPFDLDAIVEQMLAVTRPMLVSAGPLANVLVDRYWQRALPGHRQVVIDVGSALDRVLGGKDTRRYHQGWTLEHHCTLDAPPVGLVHPQSARSTAVVRATPAVDPSQGAAKRMSNPVVIVGRKGTPMPKRRHRAPLVVHDGRRHPPAAAAPVAAATVVTEIPALAPVAPHKRRRGRCSNCSKVVRSRR